MAKILNLFTNKKSEFELRLKRIKDGDKEERELIISEYTPFIIKTITNVTNRYIETENDDEYSVGLYAFNEAIDKYEFNKGNFLSFAKLVIKNRVIDYLRKAASSKKTVLFSDAGESSEEVLDPRDNEDFTYNYDMRDQILELQSRLKQFGIYIDELVERSPKHVDTRLNSIKIARYIIQDKELKTDFYRKRAIPVNKLADRKGVSQKVLKRNRKFIIATAVIFDSNMDLLKNYINEVERRD